MRFYYVQPRGDEVAKAMESAELESYTDQPVEHSFLGSLVSLLLPILLFGVLFWFLMGRVGGGSSVMSFSKSRAKKFTKDKPEVRFSDVAGVDEALAELEEVREFLAEPEKFTRLGAKIPRAFCCTALPAPGKPHWRMSSHVRRGVNSSNFPLSPPELKTFAPLWTKHF